MKNLILKLLAFSKNIFWDQSHGSKNIFDTTGVQRKWWMGEDLFIGEDKKLPFTEVDKN